VEDTSRQRFPEARTASGRIKPAEGWSPPGGFRVSLIRGEHSFKGVGSDQNQLGETLPPCNLPILRRQKRLRVRGLLSAEPSEPAQPAESPFSVCTTRRTLRMISSIPRGRASSSSPDSLRDWRSSFGGLKRRARGSSALRSSGNKTQTGHLKPLISGCRCFSCTHAEFSWSNQTGFPAWPTKKIAAGISSSYKTCRSGASCSASSK